MAAWVVISLQHPLAPKPVIALNTAIQKTPYHSHPGRGVASILSIFGVLAGGH